MLILSTVGAVGLNLASANIMIIVVRMAFVVRHYTDALCQDTLWSALDDEQLRGRIYRFPQQKIVRFYRLVARGTPDVFLNNIAFDKGMLHNAFIGINDNSRTYFFVLHSLFIHRCLLVSLFNGSDSGITSGYTETETGSVVDKPVKDDDDLIVIDEPGGRNKRGSKKSKVKNVQPSQSPPRPPVKRTAPTSPTSPQRAAPKGKKARVNKPKDQVVVPSFQPPSISSVMGPGSVKANDPVQSTPSGSKVPATMQVDETPPFDPVTDPILLAMRNDPTWELDPDELDALVKLRDELPNARTNRSSAGSSPLTNLSSLPASPTLNVAKNLPVVKPGLPSRVPPAARNDPSNPPPTGHVPSVSSAPAVASSKPSATGSVSTSHASRNNPAQNVPSVPRAGPSNIPKAAHTPSVSSGSRAAVSNTPTDEIGGVPLIPGGQARFKAGERSRGNNKPKDTGKGKRRG